MTTSFYTSYNARHLKPEEVADTFIYSESFERLIQDNHSVVLGARGCGKTTLMKMLTIPALYSWQDERAEKIRKDISFYGIYISTDIYWDVKSRYYGSELKKFGSFSDKISHFSVTSNVFTSLCDTFINIIEIELNDRDESKEIELCKSLIKAWKLPPTNPKIKYIKEALDERIDEVNQLIQDIIFNSVDSSEHENRPFFNLNFESSLEYLIPLFERIYGVEGEKKWALCFDELEFAPDWLQHKLYTSLRSRKQYILYKLSASPILSGSLEKSLRSEYRATSGNDLEIIKMWLSSDKEEFSRKLISAVVGKDEELEKIFGTNDIYNKIDHSYTEGSDFHKEILDLIEKDDSFKTFMLKKGIDIKNPLPRTKEDKDVLFRKMKPTVFYRNAYIESNRGGTVKPLYRSRKKTVELFSGVEVLSKICEGNPRWLIGIITSLARKSHSTKIKNVDQYNELLGAANRFKNVMANIPVGKIDFTIVDMIERIGSFFKENILGNQYKLDPKGSFTVDAKETDIQSNILELIEKGVSQGAFILLDTDESSFDFEIRGKRFRLSYLFSVLYYLPIRKYPSIKLSECLKGVEGQSFNQISLFE